MLFLSQIFIVFFAVWNSRVDVGWSVCCLNNNNNNNNNHISSSGHHDHPRQPHLYPHPNSHSHNRILEGDIGDLRCAKLISDVKWTETTMTAKLPPDVNGTWVSQRCEVRPGPSFLLRKYSFGDNQTFELNQFYYSDSKCTTPTHLVVAKGTLEMTGPSWLVPGGMDADYNLQNVQILAYNKQMAEQLARKSGINDTDCPSVARSVEEGKKGHWTLRQFYTIYSYSERDYEETNYGNEVRVLRDVDCLDSFGLSFHELQLVRVEHRRGGGRQRMDTAKKLKRRKVELLLGSPQENVEQKHFRPTSYQQPLSKADEADASCAACRQVSKASQLFPPQHVDSKMFSLPVELSGEWLSIRCETRTNSMFLTRRLLFYDDSRSSSSLWKGFYDYFVDPKCQSPIFSLVTNGRVVSGGNVSTIVDGATEVDFTIERLTVTTRNAAMVNNLNNLPIGTCGQRGRWALGVSQDVTATSGCSGLGLRVPSLEREIVKIELDRNGNKWLSIGTAGHHSADGGGSDEAERPTSYQWPLLQCQEYVVSYDYDQFNSLSPMSGDGISSSRLLAPQSNGHMERQTGSGSVPLVLLITIAYFFVCH